MGSFADLVDSESSGGFGSFEKLGSFSDSGGYAGDPFQRQLQLVDRYQNLAEQVGITPELVEPRENLFSRILNTLDKPKQVVLGLLDSALIRGDISKVGVIGAIDRGLDERSNWFDILRREGVKSPYVRGSVGFLGEVLTDPLTYLTFGAAAVKDSAKAGGRALSDKGLALAKEASDANFIQSALLNADELLPTIRREKAIPEILTETVDKIAVDRSIDSAFATLGAYVEATRKATSSKNPWVAKFAQAEAAKQFEKAKPFLDQFGIAADEAKDLFASNQIAIGLKLPFLGHLTGKDASIALNTSPSLVKKTAEKIGQALNPDSVTLFKANFPTQATNILQQLQYSAAKGLSQIADSELPVVSTVAKGAKKVGDATDTFIRGVKGIFNETFNLNGILGKNSQLARYELMDAKSAAKYRALFSADALYSGLKDAEDVRRDVALFIDSTANTIFDDILKDDTTRNGFLNGIENLIKSKGDISPESVSSLVDIVKQSASKGMPGGIKNVDDFIDDLFVNNMELAKQTWTGDSRTLQYVDRTISAFKDLRARETAAGVGSSILDAYIPHIVTTLRGRTGGKIGASAGFFNKQRKYSTFTQLLEEGGHLAETDIAHIFYKRFLRSEELIAEKKYLERALFESSADPELLQDAFKAVVAGDEDAYRALKVEGYNLPAGLTEDQAKSLLAKKSLPDKFTPEGRKFLKLDGAEKLPVQEQVKIIDALQNVQNETRAKALALGIKGDPTAPLSIFGEPGVRRTLDNKEYWLSPSVSRAIDDILEKKGPLEKLASRSPAFEKMLKVSDTATNWMKAMVTLPWPAYWSQNVIGDGVRRMLDQAVGVVNPASYAEAMGLLAGTNALRTPLGVITAPQFQKILQDYGVRMSYKDYLGMLDDMGRVNLSFLEKQGRSIGGNLKRLELATAAGKATERMQDVFEDFMRIQQLTHELKKGSTIASAVRSMNDVMFNYRDLTRFESSLFRRFYLFYPWLKKSTAYTLNQLFLQPGALSNQIRTARGIAETFSDPNAVPTFEERDAELLKDVVQREQVSFPLGTDKEGNQVSGRGFGLPLATPLQAFTVQIPRNFDFTEILDAANASAVRTLQKQFASSNPWANALAQKISGKNLYFDKPLDSKFINTLPRLSAIAEKLPAYSFAHIPADLLDKATISFLDGVDNGKGGYTVNPNKFFLLVNVIPGMSRAVATLNRFSNQDLQTQHKLIHFLTGIRVDPTDAQRNRVAEVAENLRQQLVNAGAFQQLQNDRLGY